MEQFRSVENCSGNSYRVIMYNPNAVSVITSRRITCVSNVVDITGNEKYISTYKHKLIGEDNIKIDARRTRFKEMDSWRIYHRIMVSTARSFPVTWNRGVLVKDKKLSAFLSWLNEACCISKTVASFTVFSLASVWNPRKRLLHGITCILNMRWPSSVQVRESGTKCERGT